MTFPKNPPLSWVEDRPAWAIPGRKVNVVTEGPDAGRAAGLLSPAAGKVVYLNDLSGRTRAPALGPSKGKYFHQGEHAFVTPSGDLVSVKTGAIALHGGHSDKVGTDDIGEASAYLQRAGRWQDDHGDLVLVGRVRQEPDGILFLGAAFHWATLQDVEIVNATTMSPEFLWDPGTQAREFCGVARVLRSALPHDDYERMPIAAELIEQPTQDIIGLCWIDETGNKVCDCEQEPVSADPIRAEVTDSDIAGLIESLEKLTERLDEIEAEIADLAMKLVSGDEIGAEDRMRGLLERIAALEEEAKRNARSSAEQIAPTSDAAPSAA